MTVYNLTDLVEQHKGNELIAPILAVAGQDISHWFNSRTGDIKTHVDAEKVVLDVIQKFSNERLMQINTIFLSSKNILLI